MFDKFFKKDKYGDSPAIIYSSVILTIALLYAAYIVLGHVVTFMFSSFLSFILSAIMGFILVSIGYMYLIDSHGRH